MVPSIYALLASRPRRPVPVSGSRHWASNFQGQGVRRGSERVKKIVFETEPDLYWNDSGHGFSFFQVCQNLEVIP